VLGASEERRERVAPTLVAQHVDELDTGRDLARHVPVRPVPRDRSLEQIGRLRSECIVDPADQAPQQQAVRVVPTLRRPSCEPIGENVGRDRRVTSPAAGGQDSCRVVEVTVLGAQPVGAVEVAPLDQAIDRSGHGGMPLAGRQRALDDSVPQVVHDELARARPVHEW
jgi:hypothetical protein